ncbi:hypothetical protein ENKNEFLB_03592 [Nocardioides aquaticus]|uniref:Uncharacterized protein n=3 Tax=Nocardioides aquaticus TaxID=160826 RepID=A0ABX8ELN6_9ACTN|nr:hypothetical protein ENKNEFLB_03592 [Nocardioides aquaticus]
MFLAGSQRAQCLPRQVTALDQINDLTDLATWRDLVDLVLLADYRADALSELEGDLGPEFATFRDALNSRAVNDLSDRWERHAAAGERREDIWREVFNPIAKHSSTVCITDGYAAKNLYAALVREPAKTYQVGPQWFLTRVANTRVKSVHLACSADTIRTLPGGSLDEVVATISRWFTAQGTGTELTLHLVPGTFKHGRRIVFDDWVGFDLHNGMASFERPRIAEEVDLHPSTDLGRHGRKEFDYLVKDAITN